MATTFAALVGLAGVPASVVGAVVLGWGAAAAVHLVMGSPAGTPRAPDVTGSLAGLGLAVDDLHLASLDGGGESRFVGHMAGAPLSVTVLGRDAAQSRAATGLARRIWMRDGAPTILWSRRATVEHRAFLLVLAERSGASVPQLVAAGTAGELDDALLVTVDPDGVRLDELDPDQLTDAVLDAAWGEVGVLHAGRIVHGDLRAHDVVLCPSGTVGLVGFSGIAPVDDGPAAAIDDATLLVTTATLVGPERALAALERHGGAGALTTVLPLLQPAALSASTRRQIPKLRSELQSLRTQAAERLGVDPPELAELRRASPASLLMTLGALLGVYLLVGELAQVNGLGAMIKTASWGWVAAAFVFSQSPQLAQAIGMIGSVSQRLPLGPATAVQFANQFMGLVGGTLATTALVIRFFQKRGLTAAVAVSSGLLNTLATMITQAILISLGLWATRGDWSTSRPSLSGGDGSNGGLLVLGILVVAAVIGAVLVVPRFRHRVLDKVRPQVASARDNLREVSGQPRKVLQLFGGNVASQILFALTLDAALLAYGADLPLLQLVVINSFASLLGGIAPIPGGMGVIEAGLIGGMVAAGVPDTQATAATFTARLFTAYLPPIWGWLSLRWLQRHDYL